MKPRPENKPRPIKTKGKDLDDLGRVQLGPDPFLLEVRKKRLEGAKGKKGSPLSVTPILRGAVRAEKEKTQKV